ncbi:hypothetical protein CNYM01_13076 [Colletotrichum nymphaeae SA-01]|uniref:Uncharacterized protein n=1 Tax=Colletotrichum nymphaeae SA-01 TaxID=1460502 RepID=A0A135SUG7_9PEZI|nr:hypothetical protein CNYM01_13076 [Colletotrichum nymphaeae SA-01]
MKVFGSYSVRLFLLFPKGIKQGCENPQLTAVSEGILGSYSAPLCSSSTPLITPHHSMTFPISEAKAAGIVSLTDNATVAQRNSEARPRIVTHHHPSAKRPFAAPSCFGSSTPLVVPGDASRTQSECRYPGYPILRSVGSHGARSLALDLCPANARPPLQVCPASW